MVKTAVVRVFPSRKGWICQMPDTNFARCSTRKPFPLSEVPLLESIPQNLYNLLSVTYLYNVLSSYFILLYIFMQQVR